MVDEAVEAGIVLAAGGVIFDRSDPPSSVVLIQRGKHPALGAWTLPGGKVVPGESCTSAAEREVREETGLCVTAGHLIEVVDLRAERTRYRIHDYLCEYRSGDLKAGDDASDARWVRIDELARLDLSNEVRRVIASGVRLARTALR